MQTLGNYALSERSKSDTKAYEYVKAGKTIIQDINALTLRLKPIVPHAIYANDKEFLENISKVAPDAIYSTDSLIAASAMGEIEMLKKLLMKPRKLGGWHEQKHVWKTALKCAIENKHNEVVRLLLAAYDYGALSDILITHLSAGDVELTKILLETIPNSTVLDLLFACQLRNRELIMLVGDKVELRNKSESLIIYLNSALSLDRFYKILPELKKSPLYKSIITEIMLVASATKNVEVVNAIMAEDFNVSEKAILQALDAKWSKYPDVEIDQDSNDGGVMHNINTLLMYPYTDAKIYASQSHSSSMSSMRGFFSNALVLDNREAIDLACNLINAQNDDVKKTLKAEKTWGKVLWMATKSEYARNVLCTQDWLELDRANFRIVGDIHYIMKMGVRIQTKHHEEDMMYAVVYNKCFHEFRLNNIAATKALVMMSSLNKTNDLQGILHHDIWWHIISFLCSDKINMMKAPFVVTNQNERGEDMFINVLSFRAKQCFADKILEERCNTTIAKAFAIAKAVSCLNQL